MVPAFPVVGCWLAYKVGDGSKFKLGEDPWIGSGINHKFLGDSINTMR